MRLNYAIPAIRRAFVWDSPAAYYNPPFLVSFFKFQNPTRFTQQHTYFSKPRFNFARIRQPQDAISLFHEMVSLKPLPSVVDFTKLLSALVRMKQHSVALHLFVEMLQRDAPVNHYTFNIAIDCFCRLNHLDFAFTILGSIQCRNLQYSHQRLFLEGKVSQAQKLFLKLWREKICELNEVTYLIVINGLCKAGHTIRACDLLTILEKGRCKPNIKAYSTVIDSLCKDKMVDDALQIFSKLAEKGICPTVVTYNSMLHGLCNFCRWKEAEQLLNKMMALKISPNVFTFSILVDAYFKEGLLKDAEVVFKIMRQLNVQPNVITYWPPPMISIVKVYVALQMPVKIYLKLNCKMLVVSDNGRGLKAYYVENYIRGGAAYEYLTCPTAGDGVIVMGSLDHSLFKVVVHREIEAGGVKLSNIRAIDHFYESPGDNFMCELLRSDPQPQPRSGSSRNGVGLSFGAKFVTLCNEGRMEMWNMSRDFIFSQNYLDFLAVIFININLKTTFVNDEKLEFQDGSLIMSYMVGMFYEIVGQSVMKASSRKFHSLLSFFDPNFVELPSTEPFDPGDLRSLNICYDAHISVFGSRLEEKLIEAKVFLVESGALSWEKYFKRLINVIDYCHSRGVFQSENLLFDVAGNLRVSNLELTALTQQVRNDGLLHSACETPNYATLEVLSDQGSDGEAAKLIWPCGVLLLALLAGYLHFDDSIWILYMRDENAGLNPIDIITELKNRHVQGKIKRGSM